MSCRRHPRRVTPLPPPHTTQHTHHTPNTWHRWNRHCDEALLRGGAHMGLNRNNIVSAHRTLVRTQFCLPAASSHPPLQVARCTLCSPCSPPSMPSSSNPCPQADAVLRNPSTGFPTLVVPGSEEDMGEQVCVCV